MFDNNLTDSITAMDRENNITDLTVWNRLYIIEHDTKFGEEFKKAIDDNGVPVTGDNNAVNMSEVFDSYINKEVGLLRGNDGELYHATVKRREIDDYGKPLGVGTSKLITDTSVYEVEYLDGTVETLSANVIAENLLSQVDQ